MVDEVTRLPVRSGKPRATATDPPAKVFEFRRGSKALVPLEAAPSTSTTLLPSYPAFVPKVETAQGKETVDTKSASDRKKITARANLRDAQFKLEEILADLKRHTDGGSRLIPRIKAVIQGMDRDLKVLDE